MGSLSVRGGSWLVLVGACACSVGVPADPVVTGVGDGSFTGAEPMTDGATTITAGATEPIDPSGVDTSDGGNASMSTDDGATTSGGDTTGGGESTTGATGAVCGDGVVEGAEACDGVDLSGMTCPDVDPMFTGGALACDAACAFDTSGCSAAANPIVQCQVVNGAIPDFSVVGLSNTIVLPPEALGVTITDVQVEVEIDHTYIGDLEIDVTSGGTNVVLFSSCSSESNLHVTFDDAGGPMNCASSDSNAVVTPTGSLASYDGAAVMSDWTLFVEDQADIDTGTLQQWCVTISWM
jgi:subtilisin-like proprotein convertase family protein